MASLEDLRVFVAVCRQGSLSAVAAQLGCSHSAVSQHVRRLERQAGTALLERGVRGVQPTAAGLLLAAGAGDGMALISEAFRRIGELAAGEAGTLRLATGGTTVRRFMAGALAELRASHPDARVEIRSESSSWRCLDAVRQDRADLAYVTLGEPRAGLELRRVVESPWVLLAPASLAPPGPEVEVADLPASGYISLSASSTSHALLSAALERAGARLEASATVEDWDSAVLLVELGLGWTILPATHCPETAPAAVWQAARIRGLAPVGFGWAARRFATLPALAREFAARVEEELASRPASPVAAGHGRSPAGGGEAGTTRRRRGDGEGARMSP